MSVSVTIGTPHGRNLTPEYVNSLIRAIGSRNGTDLHILLQEGLYVHGSRRDILKATETDYLIFIDSDMFFPPEGIQQLIDLDKPVAGGIYLKRLPPYVPLSFMFDDELKPHVINPVPNIPYQCDAIGTGFMMIRRDVIDHMRSKYQNPFDFIDLGGGNFLGEDLAFCKRLRDENIELWVEPRIKLGHVGTRIIMMDQSDDLGKLVNIDGTVAE